MVTYYTSSTMSSRAAGLDDHPDGFGMAGTSGNRFSRSCRRWLISGQSWIFPLSLDELTSSPLVYVRELSWLDFNWLSTRALDERNRLLWNGSNSGPSPPAA
ncbi:MAG: hypothetical protein R2873_19255 [Caldilineaceae bacterium]